MVVSANRIVLAWAAAAALTEAVRLRSRSAPCSRSGPFGCRAEADLVRTPTADGFFEELLERDMTIYRSHWAPLEPPPYHTLGRHPTREHFEELEALTGAYNDYWKSLPRYAEVSPLLAKAQAGPYFKVRNWANYTWQVPATREAPVSLLFVNHHKTGVVVRTYIQKVLSRLFNTSVLHEPELEVPQEWPDGVKTVHFVRDPVDTILSSYRYHRDRWGPETVEWGHGALQDPPCFNCDAEDHAAIFDTCGFNCTYFELLNRLDERSGVVVEAVSARRTLTAMATFMAFQAASPNTLHLSTDLFRVDREKTAACLLNFLGLGGNASLHERVYKASGMIGDTYHVTSGVYDNAELRAYLENHPMWAPDFRAVRDFMRGIFRRQAALWGCPESEGA